MTFDKFKKDRNLRMFKKICKEVCRYSKVKPSQLADKEARDAHVLKAKHLCIYLCQHYTPADYDDVAVFFDVSRGTVAYAIKNSKDYLTSDSPSMTWVSDVAKAVLNKLEGE